MPKIIQKLNKNKKPLYIIYSILFINLLTILTLSTGFPNNSVYADNLDYNVNIKTSLNITLSSETVSLTLNPATTPFASTDLNVSVGTNNPWGYKLYMDAESTNLTNNTYKEPVYINTLNNTVTESSFTANTWGYRISSLTGNNAGGDNTITDLTKTNFYPFVSGKLIGSATEAVNNSTSTLTFGAKVDYEKPAGVYTLDFSFRAVPKITTLTMQNLDPTVCTEDPTLVTDSRDGQTYAIARLKDGKCWMVQNLKLGKLSDNMVLTAEDSNVGDTFTLSSNEAGAKGGFPKIDRYDDPAAYGNPPVSHVMDKSEYYCTEDYGCYYNWFTATAGNGKGEGDEATEPGTTVEYDICPAGWTLPANVEGGGDFYDLATAYGYGLESESVVATKMLVTNPSTVTENINGQYAPGMLLGGFYASDGARNTGEVGRYWSRTSCSIGHGCGLVMRASSVDPLAHNVKSCGWSVRCLLQED